MSMEWVATSGGIPSGLWIVQQNDMYVIIMSLVILSYEAQESHALTTGSAVVKARDFCAGGLQF